MGTDAYYENLLSAFTAEDGTVYCIPKDVSTLATYYNIGLLESVGVSPCLLYTSAYFTGDSKIFTLRRYLKFAAVWAAVVLLWTGALLKADTVMAAKDDRMEDVTGFFLATEIQGNGYYEEDEPGGIDTIFRILRDALYQDGNPLERLSPDVRVRCV